MYPRLSDIFPDLFGFSLPFPIYSFGAMVAVAVLVAAWLSGKELDRMYRAGHLPSVRVEAEKSGDKTRRRRVEEVSPANLMGTLTIIALVTGFIGAKIFHILENLDEFAVEPWRMIFSTGGFTFFGGLVVAGGAIAWYAKKRNLRLGLIADAFAPGLMIAYGIGRIGCHLAGDGDWGIIADLSARPSWVPMWLWAETYPNNILNVDIPAPGAYPTPLYEFAMAAILFGILWSLRRHPFKPWWLFSLYLVFAGVERFLIEKIRVNNVFDVLGMQVTQAEVISVLLIVLGLVGLAVTSRKRGEPEYTPVPAAADASR